MAATWVVFAATSINAANPTATPANVDLLAGKRVMILGDSITQQGTYVSFLEYFLQKHHAAKRFDIVNVGLSSETASGLSETGHAGGAFPRPCVHERLKRALTAVKPQVVVACYGMNDGSYLPVDDERMKACQDGITKLAGDCQAAGARVILVTPPVFDAKNTEGWNYDETLCKFAEWEVKHPPQGVVAVADLHTAMSAALAERRKANPNFHFSGDSVHPNELGHLVMAQAILKGLSISMPPGSPEELLAAAKADPLFKVVCQHRETRSAAWLASIGYTRERKVAPGTGDLNAAESNAQQIQRKIDEIRSAGPTPAK
ncbi:MAG: SGNH/GDSL hydrolase family protein [Verrucomicrobiota bacterium]